MKIRNLQKIMKQQKITVHNYHKQTKRKNIKVKFQKNNRTSSIKSSHEIKKFLLSFQIKKNLTKNVCISKLNKIFNIEIRISELDLFAIESKVK